jgi:CRP-like cAMP-binding protein
MDLASWPGSPGLHFWARLEAAGDEAVLPAGTRLADEAVPGRQCFAVLEGSARAATGGQIVRELGPGSFVGEVDQAGMPAPPSGVTVRLTTSSRVLVFDAMRLAALVSADQDAAAAWRQLTSPPRIDSLTDPSDARP